MNNPQQSKVAASEIEAILRSRLLENAPDGIDEETSDGINELSRLLAGIANEESSETDIRASINSLARFETIAHSLQGQEITIRNETINFGKGNQVGDITIRDVAGRDIKYTFNIVNIGSRGNSSLIKMLIKLWSSLNTALLQTLEVISSLPRSLYFIFGLGFGLVVGVSLLNYTPNNVNNIAMSATIATLQANLGSAEATITANQNTADMTQKLYISNIETFGDYTYFSSILRESFPAYIDRKHAFSDIPDFLEGNLYIATANNDKWRSDSTFLKFTTNQSIIVYIAHDDCYKEKPSWLNRFEDTGVDLTIGDSRFSLFEKQYPAGVIALGGNTIPYEKEDGPCAS